MKTYSPKPEHIQRRWYVIDANEQVLGRLASEAAHILRGKHKPIYAPHADVGDHVIIVNASKVVLTGGKETKKVAYRHSGHPGGITATLYEDLLSRRPAFAVEKAVRGMLPKNRLGRAMIKKLHVEAGSEHRHQAQQPQAWAIGSRPAWEGLPAPAAPALATKDEAEATRPTSGRATAATKTAPAKRTAARKPAAKTTATKRTASRKPAAKAAATKRAATRKTTAAKTTARKTTATRKTTARKPAASKKKET
jgi:large subunit ribosomal protein L13